MRLTLKNSFGGKIPKVDRTWGDAIYNRSWHALDYGVGACELFVGFCAAAGGAVTLDPPLFVAGVIFYADGSARVYECAGGLARGTPEGGYNWITASYETYLRALGEEDTLAGQLGRTSLGAARTATVLASLGPIQAHHFRGVTAGQSFLRAGQHLSQTGRRMYSLRSAGRAGAPGSERLFVHLTDDAYRQVQATGYLGEGMPTLRQVFLPPMKEGRIWATPYTLEQLQTSRLRAFLTGLNSRRLAGYRHTIEVSGEAAAAFRIAAGPRFSLNGFGWLKGLAPQYQLRGQLQYIAGNTISSLEGARYFTLAESAVLRAGELQRLGLWGGIPAGATIIILKITE